MGDMRSGFAVQSAETQNQQFTAENYSNNNGNYIISNVNNNNSDKKKKKNRRSRHSKQNSSPSLTSNFVNESDHSGAINEENESIQNQQILPSDTCKKLDFNSSPNHIVEKNSLVGSSSVSNDLSQLHHSNNSHSRRKYFTPHLSADEISTEIEKGTVFKALLRVNAHNRFEAYCKIEGVETDILINGLVAQNRAIEGDIVAIEVDRPSIWAKMKGLSTDLNPESSKLGEELVEEASDNCFISAVENLCGVVNEYPLKRPTGRVVGIIELSPRRETIVSIFNLKQFLYNKRKDYKTPSDNEYMLLTPTDTRFPKLVITIKNLPECIKRRFEGKDVKSGTDLVGVRILNWTEDNYLPEGSITRVFKKVGDIEAHIDAILFENSIDISDFTNETLSCVKNLPLEIPLEEYKRRKDFRKWCIFTIDPETASDLDDALSIEKMLNGNYRVGVHIADVSYYVLPNSALDMEARFRCNSVYMEQSKLPMLPSLLSEKLGSLIPGVDRLAFSMVWEIDSCGLIIDRWIGRSIIHSCVQLSYNQAQFIVDDDVFESDLVKLHNGFKWCDVINSVKYLNEISKVLKDNRFKDGALSLESPETVFLFDDKGVPYDCVVKGPKDSDFLVEELMVLANKTAAQIITRAYPTNALLRKHPEPSLRKLKTFETFCKKHGLELNTCSSKEFHESLDKIKKELKDDYGLFDILMCYASKPMQSATYFCTGSDANDNNDKMWGHYALAIPLYTHFTSPLRRYIDIIVHRILSATLEAEYLLSKKCFTSLEEGCVNNTTSEEEVLSGSAYKYGVPSCETLTSIADHCNQRKKASWHVKDATHKLYTWVLVKNKKIMFSEARVLGLGPKFMSIYVHKLGIERRIYYDEVVGLKVEWLENTSTIIMSHCFIKKQQRFMMTTSNNNNNNNRTLDDVALIITPQEEEEEEEKKEEVIEAASFPLTISLLSQIPVALHAIGGEDGPLDISTRLYISSYT